MNVNGVSENTYVNGAGRSNPQIKAIDKQIAGIRKSIQEVKANKELDEKSKTDKIKEYEQQITMLQQQKSQIQAEERKPKQVDESQNAEAEHEAEESKGAAMQETTQKSLIQMDGAISSWEKLGPVRTELENKLRIAESDSFLNRADPGKAAEYRARISKIDNEAIKKATDAIGSVKEENETEKTSGVKAVGEEEDEAGTAEKIAREANHDEPERRGTGRFESGQFLYEEA